MLEFLVALKSLFMALIVSVSIIDCNDVTYDEETINEGVEIANREECADTILSWEILYQHCTR